MATDTLASRLDRITGNRKARAGRNSLIDTPVDQLKPADRATVLQDYLAIDIAALPDDRRLWIAGRAPLPAAVTADAESFCDWLLCY